MFLDLYARHGRDRSRVYPGVREGVVALRAHGAALACITNKPRAPAVDLLAHLELLDSFELVIGGDSLRAASPIHCRCSMPARSSAWVGSSVFVGDSINDVQAARAAGMRVACVSYGYNHGGTSPKPLPTPSSTRSRSSPRCASAHPSAGPARSKARECDERLLDCSVDPVGGLRPSRRRGGRGARRRRRPRSLRRDGQPLRPEPDDRPAGVRGRCAITA